MDFQAPRNAWLRRHPSLGYVTPFVLFLLAVGTFGRVSLNPVWVAPLWVIAFVPILFFCWPRQVSVWPKHWIASIFIGIATFVLWIAPEVLIPGYRNFALFSNSVLGHAHSSLPAAALRSSWVLAWRTARAVIVGPIVEELFWRGWMMRWLVDSRFERIRLGTYVPIAFWTTALLFASEHGPYWDVGLITGVIYNSWMIRTKSIADCILMHAVTNGALSAYVILDGQWQYWQ